MKVVRVVGYHKDLQLDETPEPKITSALDVIVKIGAAGVCRTDLHILEGQWEEKANVKLPYTIGHENAGWVHAVGDGVKNVKVGDKVILHPLVTCGLCTACRFGKSLPFELVSISSHELEVGLRSLSWLVAERIASTSSLQQCLGIEPVTLYAQ